MYSFVIWDFDGTLFDSYPRIAGDFQRALLDYGVEANETELLALLKRSVSSAAGHYERLHGLCGLRERYAYYEHLPSRPSRGPTAGRWKSARP